MQIHQQAWKNYRLLLRWWKAKNFQRNIPVRVMQRCCIVVMLILLVLGICAGFNSEKAEARTFCPRGVISHVVVHGDTLSKISARYGVSLRLLASENHIVNANLIYSGQVICIVGVNGYVRQVNKQHSPGGVRNFFPFGACTWWADQRFFQLHGVFVPWKTGASAWQWVERAYQFGWRVSSNPSPGAIVVLQPWIEGAYGMGHVAVVERILKNGHVIASNMSWGRNPWRVTYVQFAPGPGVRFISQ
ncbi:MAG TPA: CHAP domain-containing protein [Ktedonobacteraceae bacterium]|nr:CHAP domain-containing protein [Ktedonobacteraceae bacterium]